MRPAEALGEMLWQLRDARGLSQERVAQRMTEMGFPSTQSTIARIEAAKRPVNVDELFALSHVLGVYVRELLYDPADADGRFTGRERIELIRRDELEQAKAQLQQLEQTRAKFDAAIEDQERKVAEMLATLAQPPTTRRRSGGKSRKKT